MTFPDMNAELLQIIYDNPWLSPYEKQVFELRYREGLYYYQISQRVHKSERQIRRDFDKILDKLRPVIIKYYNEHPEYFNLEVSV